MAKKSLVSGSELDLSPQVGAFCRQHRVTSHLKAAVALVRESFPFLQDLNMRLESDPEEAGEWIVIEVAAKEDIDTFLAAYNECVDRWARQLPTKALSVIRLSYSLA